MINYIRKVMNPDWYHGQHKHGPFFEGWYYKVINKAENRGYAFIPGVFINPDPAKTHAFIQVLNGMEGTATYHRYPFDSFYASDDSLDMRIGNSRFKQNCLMLAIDDEQKSIQGELHFEGQVPWPVTIKSPGIMGWYGWLPFMECYHGVVSMDHSIRGNLIINGENTDFTGGRGYIEKDWGSNFPDGYIWQQSNHFETPGTSLTASIATIPLGPFRFPGFIIGLWHESRLYRFTKYTGAKVEHLSVSDDAVHWSVYDRKYHLEIRSTRAEGGLLKGPEKTDMHKRVDETMLSTVELWLSTLKDGQKETRYHDIGRRAALEVVGDLGMLLKP